MIRLRVLIFDDDYRELRRVSKRDKIPISEHVRRAIRSYVLHMKHWEETYHK